MRILLRAMRETFGELDSLRRLFCKVETMYVIVVYLIHACQGSTQASFNFLSCVHLVIVSLSDCMDASTQSKYICEVLLSDVRFDCS